MIFIASKSAQKQSEIEQKNDLITDKIEELREIYSSLPEDKMKLADKLIHRAAFMEITLKDLEDEVKKGGPIEKYQNGANQHGLKESSALKSYNSTMQRFESVIKTLNDMLPDEIGSGSKEAQDLLNFASGK